MKTPSAASLRVFIESVDKLCSFEGFTLKTRGYGAFPNEPRPIPEFAEVFDWLRPLTKAIEDEGGK